MLSAKRILIFICILSGLGIVLPASFLAADHAHSKIERAAIYHCPMHPQVVSDKPGDCPICHMRLVKIDADEVKMMLQGELRGELVPAGYASVLISPQKQQLIGIRTAVVQKKELIRTLRTSAKVAYDPELYEAQITYLREYRVSQGTLRDRELAFKNLYDSRWEASRIEVARSKLILLGMDEDSIKGLVEAAKADDALLYLDPKGDVWVYAYVFESEAPQLKKGDAVRIEIPSDPKRIYEGMVHDIGAMVDPATRRVHVHVRLKNDGYLRPEMLLNATIGSSAGEGLAVPEEAVFFTGKASIVFVDKGQGVFEPRQVEVGIKAGEDHQILSGLSEGERIVVNGNFLLDSESRLKASVEQAAALHAGHSGKEANRD